MKPNLVVERNGALAIFLVLRRGVQVEVEAIIGGFEAGSLRCLQVPFSQCVQLVFAVRLEQGVLLLLALVFLQAKLGSAIRILCCLLLSLVVGPTIGLILTCVHRPAPNRPYRRNAALVHVRRLQSVPRPHSHDQKPKAVYDGPSGLAAPFPYPMRPGQPADGICTNSFCQLSRAYTE